MYNIIRLLPVVTKTNARGLCYVGGIAIKANSYKMTFRVFGFHELQYASMSESVMGHY